MVKEEEEEEEEEEELRSGSHKPITGRVVSGDCHRNTRGRSPGLSFSINFLWDY